MGKFQVRKIIIGYLRIIQLILKGYLIDEFQVRKQNRAKLRNLLCDLNKSRKACEDLDFRYDSFSLSVFLDFNVNKVVIKSGNGITKAAIFLAYNKSSY